MKLEDFQYDLSSDLIASHPLSERNASQMLVLDKKTGAITDSHFKHFLDYVSSNDLLVFNDTRVMNARLSATKETGGKVSLLVERLISSKCALLHIKSNKKLHLPCLLNLPNDASIRVIAKENALYKAELLGEIDFYTLMENDGEVPLPPYMKREAQETDIERYQTVYANKLGAVAAPTAGLHFDQSMMQALVEKGIPHVFITLHVGAGTFQPVKSNHLDDHVMHYEYSEISSEACDAIQACKARGGRVIAVGTTVVRTLESFSNVSGPVAQSGMTNLFIKPPYAFKCVDAIFTNFHLPASTLLMLISAFGGYDHVMQAYAHAVQKQYRFFSYGVAMFIY